MTVLTYDEIFKKAIEIMLSKDHSMTIHFSENNVCIRFPTTRKLADELHTPHYYVLPYFALMEKDGLITRVERKGISTTMKGSRLLLSLMTDKDKEETEAIIGAALFKEIQKRVMTED
jgi:DNA-binding transcriptional regulator YhcF (GntR family)